MKIKIKRRWNLFPQTEQEPKEWLDIYHGFTGLPTTLPLLTKWKIAKSGLTEAEVIEYLKPYISSGGVKIIIE